MFVDAHHHLDLHGAGVSAALAEIRERRILTIAVSLDPDSYRRTVELAAGEPLVLPAFGVHPARAADWVGRLDEVVEQAERAPQIGEVGLDRHFVRDRATDAAQRRVLDALLEVAARRDIPVNLHTKAAESEIADAVDSHCVQRAVVHWYSGPVRDFRRVVDLGCWFTVGVEVLTSDAIREVARQIPEERLLTETDAPNGWKWLRGTPGAPGQVADVVAELARVRGMRAKALRALVWRNVGELFAGCPTLEAAQVAARA